MRAFIPFEITDDMLISSSLDEPSTAEPLYNVNTSYALSDEVSDIQENSHLVYKSLVNNNLGNALTDTTKWKLKGKTNRHRMFDYNQGNPSIGQSPMTVVLRPGKRIDAIALDLKATELDITVRNGIDGPLIYSMDAYLLERNVTSWYEYFYAPFVYRRLISTFNIPPAPDPVIYLTLKDSTGTVELNRFAIGQSVYLGEIQDTDPIVDTNNYSQITTDDFGTTTFVPVPSKPKADLTVFAPASKTDLISQFKKESEAKIVVWSGLDDIDNPYAQSLIMFGFHRGFPIDPSDRNIVSFKLTIMGV